MARVPKGRRKRALKRDNSRCGIHLGGCGKPIQWDNKNIPPGDHIIPESLFNKTAENPQAFQDDWNIQPMHEQCGEEKSDRLAGSDLGQMEMFFSPFPNTPDQLPLFRCSCHYLQVSGEDLYICTRGRIDEGKYKLLSGFVKDFGDSNRQDAIMVVAHWPETGGTMRAGYSNLERKPRGYLFPSISPRRVEEFNISEQIRVGLPFPKRIYLDERGRVIPVSRPT